MRHLILFLIGILVAARGNSQCFDTDHPSYDYVIVGGGPGGLLAAKDLSASHLTSVLLLEQGISSPTTDLKARMLSGSRYQDTFIPQPQSFTALLRAPTFVQYRAIGGTAEIYGSVYTRGSKEFIDRHYPEGYKYDDLPFKSLEDHYCHYLPPVLTNISEADCLQYHGKGGEMQISPQAYKYLSPAIHDLIAQLGHSFGATADYNNPSTRRGVGYEQSYRSMDDKRDVYSIRRRVDAQSAFLTPDVVARPNLVIQPRSRVTRLVFENNRIIGVEYVLNGTIPMYVHVNKKVILSAGVLRTPQLLHLSGVGPKEWIQDLGIQLIADNPFIGTNLEAHQAVMMGFETKEPIAHAHNYSSFNAFDLFFNTGLSPDLAVDIQVEGLEGFYVSSIEGPANSFPVQLFTRYMQGQTALPFIGLAIENVNPSSTGYVKTVDPDPIVDPIFDYGWTFENVMGSNDLKQMMIAITKMREVMTNSSFATRHIVREVWPGEHYRNELIAQGVAEPELSTKADLLFIQYGLTHFYHVTSSVALGRATNLNGEVNGVEGVVICDNSVLPKNPDGNPTATMLAVCREIIRRVIAENC